MILDEQLISADQRVKGFTTIFNQREGELICILEANLGLSVQQLKLEPYNNPKTHHQINIRRINDLD